MSLRSARKVDWCRSAAALLLLFAGVLHAAEGERIGLVLGGGGARGAAHIGVLKVLEKEHIPIHAIAGTSIGAIVGALYASGQSPEEIEQAFNSIDWREIFHDGTARVDLPMRQKETDLGILANLEVGLNKGKLSIPTTLVRGQKLGLLLRRLFLGRANVQDFDDLPIPFRSVATDISVVRPVVFSSGDLALAVRASMAVPGAFAPVELDGKVLVDGGIVNNVPIDVARAMGVDRLIIVDVASPTLPADKVDGSLDILLQMVTGMMRDRTEEQLKAMTDRDMLLRPELPRLSSIDFENASDGIEPGEQAALAVVEQLRAFSVPEPEYLAWQSRQRQRYQPPPQIDFVHVVTDQSATAEFVRDRISLRAGDALDTKVLDKEISGAYGRGTYESISYHLTTDARGRTGIEILPIDSGLGRTVFRAGLQISDDFAGSDGYQLNLEGRVTGLNDKGAEWRTFLGLGRVTALMTDVYLPFGERGNWFFTPEVGHTELTQPVYLEGDSIAEYRVGSWLGGFRIGRDFGDRFRLTAGMMRGQDHAKARVADPALPRTLTSEIGGVTTSMLWDSLDNVRFPHHGLRAEINYSMMSTELGSDTDGNLLRISIDKAISRGRNTVIIGGRASLSKDRIDAFQTESSLGGLTYLSGLGDRELLGEQMLLLRAVEYHRLTKEGLLFDLPLYLAGSLEAGNVWDSFDDVSFGDLIGAASVFIGIDLPVGPLQLGYGRTFDGRDSFYLTFGSLVLPRYR